MSTGFKVLKFMKGSGIHGLGFRVLGSGIEV